MVTIVQINPVISRLHICHLHINAKKRYERPYLGPDPVEINDKISFGFKVEESGPHSRVL